MRYSFSRLCLLLAASAAARATPTKRGTQLGNGIVEDGTQVGNGVVPDRSGVGNGVVEARTEIGDDGATNYWGVGNGLVEDGTEIGNGVVKARTEKDAVADYIGVGNGEVADYAGVGNGEVADSTFVGNGEVADSNYGTGVGNGIVADGTQIGNGEVADHWGVGNGAVEPRTENGNDAAADHWGVGNGVVVNLASTPSVSSADDISITVTVENTGSQDVTLLKYGSILDNEHPTKSFTITTGDGNEVTFQGTRLHLSNDLPDAAFIVIPAGGTVTATHSNLNGVYDLSGGPGTYTFEAARTTYGSSNSTINFKSSASVEVQVTGNTTKRALKMDEKRGNLVCEDPNGAAQIQASYSEALGLAALAVQYIQTFGPTNALYQVYFGPQAVDIPLTVLARVANENSNRNFYCYDPTGDCTEGVIAYTLTATRDIYFCGPFFLELPPQRLCTDSPPAARHIRGGTTLHELTHAQSGTTDITYGCDSDIYLASVNPLAAVANADNYNCFATSVYYYTQC